MMRGLDTEGTIVLGLTRTEVDGICMGKPCFFESRPEIGGGPRIVLWFAETDEELVRRIRRMFASGPVPFPIDLRTKETHGVIFHGQVGP